jgi:hypothetical protein
MPWQPTRHLECNHALLKVDFEHEHVLEADTELSNCYVLSKKQNKTLFETDDVNIYPKIKHEWLEDVMETKVRTAVDTAGQCSGVADLGTGNCGHRHV